MDGVTAWLTLLHTARGDSYRQNSAYHLPPSLTPTSVQRGVAHEFIIDGVVQPCLRDQLILMRGKYDIMTIFQELVTEISIPGGVWSASFRT